MHSAFMLLCHAQLACPHVCDAFMNVKYSQWCMSRYQILQLKCTLKLYVYELQFVTLIMMLILPCLAGL